MKFRVGVISGDGIGPEIVKEAKKVLDKVGSEFGHEFEYEERCPENDADLLC